MLVSKSSKLVLVLGLLSFLISCAQVPKESMTLSQTIGRDVSELKSSHLALVDLYYSKLFAEVNDFVDTVYAPFQIQGLFSDPEINAEILSDIATAAEPSAKAEEKTRAFGNLQSLVTLLHQDISDYRRSKLEPIEAQYQSIRKKIDDAYGQVHYANSIVTGHLASVLEVHDMQNDILASNGLNGLRSMIGEKTSDISDQVRKLTERAKKGQEKLQDAITKFDELSEKF